MQFNSKKQAGFSMAEMIMVLALISIGTIIAFVIGQGLMSSSSKNAASTEGQKVVQASRVYRQNTRSYAGISIAALAGGGYDIEPFSTGTGENTYNLNVTLAPANSNGDATMVYQTNSASACSQFIQRMNNAEGVKATSCTDGDATVTIE